MREPTCGKSRSSIPATWFCHIMLTSSSLEINSLFPWRAARSCSSKSGKGGISNFTSPSIWWIALEFMRFDSVQILNNNSPEKLTHSPAQNSEEFLEFHHKFLLKLLLLLITQRLHINSSGWHATSWSVQVSRRDQWSENLHK